MIKVDVLDSSQINYQDYASVINEAFKEVLEGANSSEVLNAELFSWKHVTPVREAKIAVVELEGERVAHNAMFPLITRIGKTRIRSWQSCDTVTLPAARGKGCFMMCLNALQDSLEHGEFFFGFPNNNSIKGFFKIGWSEIGDVRTWVRPLIVLPRRQSQYVHEITTFGSDHDVCFEKVAIPDVAMLQKDADYLNWRYKKHPNATYQCLEYRRGGQVEGIVVFREAVIKGMACMIIMDILSVRFRAEYALLQSVMRAAQKAKLLNVFTLSSAPASKAMLASGFLPIPGWLIPKRQVLMGEASGEAVALLNMPWHAQAGDWDAL